jgi:chemotaxis signal transduction protein
MTVSAVMFPIGEDRYAVAASVVREVVADPHPTRLPTAPAVLLGAFNLRGEVVPMFDTAMLLGIGNLIGTSVAVIVNTTVGPAALVVSGYPKFVVLEDEFGPSELPGTLGVYTVGDGLAVMLDIETLLVPHAVLNGTAVAEALIGS